MSNQDEDEVEDELAALEAEINGVHEPAVATHDLPDAPSQEPIAKPETQKERWSRRAREQREEQEAILA